MRSFQLLSRCCFFFLFFFLSLFIVLWGRALWWTLHTLCLLFELCIMLLCLLTLYNGPCLRRDVDAVLRCWFGVLQIGCVSSRSLLPLSSPSSSLLLLLWGGYISEDLFHPFRARDVFECRSYSFTVAQQIFDLELMRSNFQTECVALSSVSGAY